jgi:hypothetical protein
MVASSVEAIAASAAANSSATGNTRIASRACSPPPGVASVCS